MEEYIISVMEAVQSAAMESLPLSGGSKSGPGSRVVTGWSEHVKPYAEESKFWATNSFDMDSVLPPTL